jgi:hypothetical protein
MLLFKVLIFSRTSDVASCCTLIYATTVSSFCNWYLRDFNHVEKLCYCASRVKYHWEKNVDDQTTKTTIFGWCLRERLNYHGRLVVEWTTERSRSSWSFVKPTTTRPRWSWINKRSNWHGRYGSSKLQPPNYHDRSVVCVAWRNL